MGARREALKPPKRATRRQRRIVQVVAEGETELDYLRLNSVRALIRDAGDVSLSIVDHHKGQTDPASLVKTMTSKGRGPRDLQRNDEQWLVMDVDEWTPGQMRKAVEWASKDQRRGLAISNRSSRPTSCFTSRPQEDPARRLTAWRQNSSDTCPTGSRGLLRPPLRENRSLRPRQDHGSSAQTIRRACRTRACLRSICSLSP